MAIEILMPALSPTMTEGKLAKWHVKVGDVVKSGQVLCEIETDKATMEVEAVDEGRIGQLVVAEGTEARFALLGLGESGLIGRRVDARLAVRFPGARADLALDPAPPLPACATATCTSSTACTPIRCPPCWAMK